ncbi:hypothetical protein GW17_00031233 [Ensete ventricosum]|nr:hypothetical protein GW17_00031233 [Ensete ventricosum]
MLATPKPSPTAGSFRRRREITRRLESIAVLFSGGFAFVAGGHCLCAILRHRLIWNVHDWRKKKGGGSGRGWGEEKWRREKARRRCREEAGAVAAAAAAVATEAGDGWGGGAEAVRRPDPRALPALRLSLPRLPSPQPQANASLPTSPLCSFLACLI